MCHSNADYSKTKNKYNKFGFNILKETHLYVDFRNGEPERSDNIESIMKGSKKWGSLKCTQLCNPSLRSQSKNWNIFKQYDGRFFWSHTSEGLN